MRALSPLHTIARVDIPVGHHQLVAGTPTRTFHDANASLHRNIFE
jgi:hypothetical protein